MSDEFIPRELARIRIERGLTQEAVAQSIGVSARALGCWETCINSPNYKCLSAWARRLGYELDLVLLERRREAAE